MKCPRIFFSIFLGGLFVFTIKAQSFNYNSGESTSENTISQTTSSTNLDPLQKNTKASIVSNQPLVKKHMTYLSATFLFGVGGDVIFSGLYVVPVGGGGQAGYIYNDNFMRYNLFIVANIARFFSPYEKINPGYDEAEINQLLTQQVIHFSSTFSVWQGKRMNLKIGPGLHYYSDIWSGKSSPSIGITRLSWFTHTGLGLDIYWNWIINSQNQISIETYLPIFNVGWRPGYSLVTFDAETLIERDKFISSLFLDPFFMSFHNFVFLNLHFHYEYFFTSSWSLKTTYQSIIQFVTKPRKRLDVHNLIQLGIAFHW